jgi:hypothetical protein
VKPLVALITLVTSLSAHAGTIVQFAWDANAEPVSGYRLYWGQASRQYITSNQVTTTTASVSNLVAGQKYYFAVTAFNADQESLPSAEVTFTPPLNAPKNFRIEVTLQTADNPRGPWRDYVSTIASSPLGPDDKYLRSTIRALPE